MEEKKKVGIILSGATTDQAVCQLLESAEKGHLFEGMLVLIKTQSSRILCRVASIIPYNAFYSEGDPWSEARRKDMPIPEEIARRYEICKLDLLIEMGKGRMSLRYPPQPGDKVLKLNPNEHQEDIFGVTEQDPGYIWLGTLFGYPSSPIPLNIEKIPMHFAIFGITGSGKSFDTGVLIERLANIKLDDEKRISYPIIIIDAHGDYTDYADYYNEYKKFKSSKWIKRYIFPRMFSRIDKRKIKNLNPISIHLDLISQRELAEIIILFQRGSIEGAEQQVSFLDGLFDHMHVNGYTSRHDIFLYSFKDLLKELLKYAKESNMHSSTRSAIDRAIRNFHQHIEVKHQLLSVKSDLQKYKTEQGSRIVEFIETITKEGGIAIFDFSADGAPGVPLAVKQLVMTYLAALLFEQFTDYKIKKEENYLLFMIEEAQNFVPDRSFPIGSSLAHSKLSAIATQGRKFGLSLCIIAQRPAFVDRIVLSQCNSFLIHRISREDLSYVRSVTGGLPSSLESRLTNLEPGELILTGQMLTVPFPLYIKINKEERMIEQTIGKTNVLKSLANKRGISN